MVFSLTSSALGVILFAHYLNMFLVRNSVPCIRQSTDGLKIILSHNRLKQGKTVKITVDSPKRIVKSELKNE